VGDTHDAPGSRIFIVILFHVEKPPGWAKLKVVADGAVIRGVLLIKRAENGPQGIDGALAGSRAF
jgi:hypothetical protein